MLFKKKESYVNKIKVITDSPISYPFLVDSIWITLSEEDYILGEEMKKNQVNLVDELVSQFSIKPSEVNKENEGYSFLWKYPHPIAIRSMTDMESIAEEMFEHMLSTFEVRIIAIYSLKITLNLYREDKKICLYMEAK